MAATKYTQKTVTASTSGGAIPWPEPDHSEQEALLMVSTPNGAVEAMTQADLDAGKTKGIEAPNSEVNYRLGRWRLNSDDKPTVLYASTNTDCRVIIVQEE